jgi:hypothetical protein
MRDWIKMRTGNKVVKYLVVSEEAHEDGTPHMHMFFTLDRVLDVKSERYFDYLAKHPNIQVRRRGSWKVAVEYVKKSGDYLEDGDFTDVIFDGSKKVDLVEAAKTLSRDDYLNFLATKHIGLALGNEAWEMYRGSEDMENVIREGDPERGVIRHKGLLRLIRQPGSRRTILLIGESGAGKTTWAARNLPKPVLIVTRVEDLRRLSHPSLGIKSFILDDFPFHEMDGESVLRLVDRERGGLVKARYRDIKVSCEIDRIITANLPIPQMSSHLGIKRRTCTIELKSNDNLAIEDDPNREDVEVNSIFV